MRVISLIKLIVVITAVSLFGFFVKTFNSGPGIVDVGSAGFEAVPLGTSLFVNDMGLADVNNDGNLDIYSSNHSNSGALWLNDGEGGFTRLSQESFSLQQDRQFPGLAPDGRTPETPQTGLYIYFLNGGLVFRNHGHSEQDYRGAVEVPWDQGQVDVEKSGAASVEVGYHPGDTAGFYRVIFSIPKEGQITVTPQPTPTLALPIAIELQSGTPLRSVFIGYDRVSPLEKIFSLKLRDRHGMAWMDIDNNGLVDVYIGRGGIRGRMSDVWPDANDELLLAGIDSFVDRATQLGIDKAGCPARQVAWVSADPDGQLGLYVVCGRGRGVTTHFPNQFYHQVADGSFQKDTGENGLAIPSIGSFVWLDVDRDGDQDMVWSEPGSYRLYRNQGGIFTPEIIDTPTGSADMAEKLTVADYDGDGDLDIFAASKTQSLLLVNTGASFESRTSQSMGLPAQALSASWVDYDNDGVVELYAIPDGLFLREREGRRFEKSGFLSLENGDLLSDARVGWFDADNDGDMDMVMAYRARPRYKRMQRWFEGAGYRAPVWTIVLYKNIAAGRHWLQVDVKQPDKRMAPGAIITLSTGDSESVVQSGQWESAHYSQGHYRSYFGLGDSADPVRLEVQWPGGRTEVVESVPVDQRLTIQ